MEMKKIPLKQSRSGRTSATIWWLNSDSEITSPAINAPSARGQAGHRAVNHAVPRQIHSTTKRIKTSRFLTTATSCNNRGSNLRGGQDDDEQRHERLQATAHTISQY